MATDWPRIISGLIHAGWEVRIQAARLGCSRHQLDALHNGQVDDPKHSVSEPVLLLHAGADRAGLLKPYPPRRVGVHPGRGLRREASESVNRLLTLGLSPWAIGCWVGVSSECIYTYRIRQCLTPVVTADKLDDLLDRCERTSLFDIMCPPRRAELSQVLAPVFSRRK